MGTKIRLFDYHTQTLEHGLNKPILVEETIQAAIKKGLSAICLTDHYPLPPGFVDPTDEKDCSMPMFLYPEYQKQVKEVVEKYASEIEALRGAEFNWLPDYKEWTKSEIDRWPFDYVIGSVHFLGEIEDERGKRNLVLDYKEEEFRCGIAYYGGIRLLVEAYYGEIKAMARSGLFDGIGHLDLIKKYNDGDLFSEGKKWYRKTVLETLDVIAETKMILELNTAGWDKKCKASYPSFWILKETRKRNIPVTLGSDGHTPETIGRNLDKGLVLIRKAGYRSIVRFRKRKPISILLQ